MGSRKGVDKTRKLSCINDKRRRQIYKTIHYRVSGGSYTSLDRDILGDSNNNNMGIYLSVVRYLPDLPSTTLSDLLQMDRLFELPPTMFYKGTFLKCRISRTNPGPGHNRSNKTSASTEHNLIRTTKYSHRTSRYFGGGAGGGGRGIPVYTLKPS